jgi:hypothetical protein
VLTTAARAGIPGAIANLPIPAAAAMKVRRERLAIIPLLACLVMESVTTFYRFPRSSPMT